MNRTIRVEVDPSTWLGPTVFPQSFPTTTETADINIPSLLLLIGFLTTPSRSAGVSLSDCWAWVRYLHSISNDPDIRITNAFAELDSHQKTILSDDFGMGLPIYWLSSKLQLHSICDGRYFIDRIASSVGANSVRKAKRGPNKAPDFLAKDTAGVWHTIECKGTQSGDNYRTRQLGSPGPPLSGAVAQKSAIIFPAEHTGQRLACGVLIGIEGQSVPSSLRIIDPTDKARIEIRQNQLRQADDAILRATVAKSLRLAGFGTTSSLISVPSGKGPVSRLGSGPTEGRFLDGEMLIEKVSRAKEEMNNRMAEETFSVDGKDYIGRQAEFDLPIPVQIDSDGAETKTIRIRQGVKASFISELSLQLPSDGLLQETDILGSKPIGKMTTEADHSAAQLKIGSLFVSELDLKS